jgi:hypothetical protein
MPTTTPSERTTPPAATEPPAWHDAGLTARQLQLIELITSKTRHGVPAVQRDLAESLGIRRDSLNKLLARTRRALAARGISIELPARSRPASVVGVCSLSALAAA